MLDRAVEFVAEEFRWLAQHGVVSADAFADSERVGRAGTRVLRAERPALFEAYERYKVLRNAADKRFDWDDLSHAVIAELEADAGVRRYRHVVIGEGQDLSPTMLRSLVMAVPADGSVNLFFGDMAQQIYGNRMSWRRFQRARGPHLEIRGELPALAPNRPPSPGTCADAPLSGGRGLGGAAQIDSPREGRDARLFPKERRGSGGSDGKPAAVLPRPQRGFSWRYLARCGARSSRRVPRRSVSLWPTVCVKRLA